MESYQRLSAAEQTLGAAQIWTNSESNFHGIISDSQTYIKNKEGNWFNLLDFKKGKKDIIDSNTLEKDFKFKISAQNIETF